jgi:hypothetical protein
MGKLLAVLFASLVCAAALPGSTIQYVESGQLSGTLGTTNLNNVSFVFTFIGNTASITGNGSTSEPYENTALSNTITIGSSNGSFTGSVEVGDIDASSLIGFSNPSLTSYVAFLNSVAATYKLASAVGPLTATSSYAGGSFTTSLGTLTITGAQDLSFKATIATAPEPSLVGLSAFGVFAIILAGWRKSQRASAMLS